MYLAATLYLIGGLMVLTFMDPEEGYENEHKLLAMFWPVFTMIAVIQDMFMRKDDKE